MRIEKVYLLFARFDPSRIDVIPLEGGKKELARAGIIAVRAREHDWDPQILEDPLGRDGGMIFRIIDQNNSVFSPVWPFFIEDPHEAVKKDLHNLSVGVRLHEA